MSVAGVIADHLASLHGHQARHISPITSGVKTGGFYVNITHFEDRIEASVWCPRNTGTHNHTQMYDHLIAEREWPVCEPELIPLVEDFTRPWLIAMSPKRSSTT